jgi:hypothetical protein
MSSSKNLIENYTGMGGLNSWKYPSQFFLCFILPPAHYNYVRHNYINGIIGHLTGDVVNIVTLSTWQYEQNKNIKSDKIKIEKRWFTMLPKVSPYTLPKCIQIFTWDIVFSRKVQKRYAHVPERTKKIN